MDSIHKAIVARVPGQKFVCPSLQVTKHLMRFNSQKHQLITVVLCEFPGKNNETAARLVGILTSGIKKPFH